MRRVSMYSLWILGIGALCAVVLGAVERLCASHFERLYLEDRAHEGLLCARVACALWPSQTNKLNYAFALLSGYCPDEHKRAQAVVEAFNWNNRDLPSKAYCVRADYEAVNRRYDKASEVLQQGLLKYPDDDYLWYTLGRARNLQHRWQDALRAYDKAVALTPKGPSGAARLRCLFEPRIPTIAALGDSRLGMRVSQQAMAAFPQEPHWLDCYAEFAEAAGDLTTAAQTWQHAISISPTAPRIYRACIVFGKLREPDNRELLLRMASSLAPFALHYCRAALYCYVSPERAHQELVEAAQSASDDQERLHAQFLIAASLMWLGKPQESAAQLRKAQTDETMGAYLDLYIIQTEALTHPTIGLNLAEGYKRAMMSQMNSAGWVEECQDIISGEQLRMPRYMGPPDGQSAGLSK